MEGFDFLKKQDFTLHLHMLLSPPSFLYVLIIIWKFGMFFI